MAKSKRLQLNMILGRGDERTSDDESKTKTEMDDEDEDDDHHLGCEAVAMDRRRDLLARTSECVPWNMEQLSMVFAPRVAMSATFVRALICALVMISCLC